MMETLTRWLPILINIFWFVMGFLVATVILKIMIEEETNEGGV